MNHSSLLSFVGRSWSRFPSGWVYFTGSQLGGWDDNINTLPGSCSRIEYGTCFHRDGHITFLDPADFTIIRDDFNHSDESRNPLVFFLDSDFVLSTGNVFNGMGYIINWIPDQSWDDNVVIHLDPDFQLIFS